MNSSLKKVIAEFLGTFVYLVAIAGASAAQSPFRGLTTALTLGLMILTLGGISGGHFNPAISIYFFAKKQISFGLLVSFVVAQLAGALAGTATGLALWDKAITPIAAGNQVTAPIFIGEAIATAGLIFVIGTLVNNKQTQLIWIAVAAWFFAASSFTPTSAFANPAVSFGWMYNGISTGSTASIVVAQLAGLLVAILVLLVTGAATQKKAAAKKEAPKFVPAPIVAAPAAAATATVAKPAAKKPAAKKPAAKKAAATKTVAKPATKKAPAKKPAVKKPAAKK